MVGAGWAGLAAAVTLSTAGRHVTLYEMAARPGGRARAIAAGPGALDNGQHILIGAYRATLDLMRQVGADPSALLIRLPLTLRYPDGRGLQLPRGPALIAFVRGVLGARGWRFGERAALLMAAGGWLARRFECDSALTVAQLCNRLPARVRTDLIEPLCVAALNTHATEASATVFLRILKDALFSGPGAADLLLPGASLDALLPTPALEWLRTAGADSRMGRRVQTLAQLGADWTIDGEVYSGVVLACSAVEAARLTAVVAPAWSARAADLRYEPIVTVYLQAPGARLPCAMVALDGGENAPAQFIFDLGALGGSPGRFACAVSGAASWVERGPDLTGQAALDQITRAFPPGTWPSSLAVERVLVEKRATFRCTPGLQRPAPWIGAGLHAAGDYVEGPYPATLEGAVRSGINAAKAVLGSPQTPA